MEAIHFNEVIDLFCKKKDNCDLLKKYIEKYNECEHQSSDDLYNICNICNICDKDIKDIVYEVGFLLKNEKVSLKDTFELLKNKKLFKNHPNFNEIDKKMKEMDEFMDKPFQVEEGVNVCNKCSSKRTLSYNRQTRGGDEGMTVYVFCIDCKYRYTMNS
jgi:DNA-directed RNA polymerase subunit M/transcription elongation factor TFIIS